MGKGKKIYLACFFGLLFLLPPMDVRAGEEQGAALEAEDYISGQMQQIELDGIQEGFQELFPEYSVDMDRIFSLILQGEITEACKSLFEDLSESVSGQLSGLKEMLVSIMVIGIVSALFSNFSDLFAGQQISQAGFYFLYLFLMAVLTKAFLFASGTAVETIENIVLFVKLFIPAYCLAVGAAAGATAAVFYYQLMLAVAYLAESFLLTAVIPFVYSYVVLALLNGIWAEERLSLLLELMKKGIDFSLKAAMGVIAGFSLVQSAIAPVLNGLKLSALQKTLSAIPGIGGVAEGVTDLMIGSAVLIKNSMGVLLLLLLLLASLLPLLKILAVAGLIKLGAALTGIVSDKRISGCTDRVGEGCLLLFRCVFASAALFFIVIGVVAYSIG